jgi:hypothetical protein
MSTIAQELDQRLRTLDPATAERMTQLVRDALALVGNGSAHAWPDGYFVRTAGALAGEKFERPEQGTAETRGTW